MRGKDEAESCRAKNALWAKLMARCTGERAKCFTTWHYRPPPLPKRSYPVMVPLEASAAVQKSRSRNLIHGHPCGDRVVTSDLNSSRPIDLIERNEETIHQPTVRSSSYQDRRRHVRQRHLPSLSPYGPFMDHLLAEVSRWFKRKKKGLLNLIIVDNRYMLVLLRIIFKIDT